MGREGRPVGALDAAGTSSDDEEDDRHVDDGDGEVEAGGLLDAHQEDEGAEEAQDGGLGWLSREWESGRGEVRDGREQWCKEWVRAMR